MERRGRLLAWSVVAAAIAATAVASTVTGATVSRQASLPAAPPTAAAAAATATATPSAGGPTKLPVRRPRAAIGAATGAAAKATAPPSGAAPKAAAPPTGTAVNTTASPSAGGPTKLPGPPKSPEYTSGKGYVWVAPAIWNAFLAIAEATMRTSSAPKGTIASALGTIRATPVRGRNGWVCFRSVGAWEELGRIVGRVMAVDKKRGRSGGCAASAHACLAWWNFTGCTSRTYCCCPPFCDAVFRSFGALKVASGPSSSVHFCCVESFC
ncbi:hypothetical protein BU14_0229s0035 [Porphyra umbilicalis]|uniref:Uncharacterized protein n=1 Tax=Porphyra umbilicalis TaxID=2786 RepID=A0A1X6P466_PORUM|nr:hypothetical protein BU14_0229s0035 [Porphyra umbilicalis]|eukprot:OSX75647.1 hypothetical protein BU14_0229s0035 [Porphyra umbilicalis]